MKCRSLRNIPDKKVQSLLKEIINSCDECRTNNATLENGMCKKCLTINKAFSRYAGANIPVKYWKLEMTQHFKGDQSLLETYKSVVADIKETYDNGTSICFAGSFGVGKSMAVTNILKRAVEKGYDALYVTLGDIISAMMSDQKYEARTELLTTDFLVIDEIDQRYAATEYVSDFFGRTLEDVLRSRSQNCLPTFMCTNSADVTDTFSGIIKQSISSLMNEVNTVIVLGSDYRASGGK